MAIDRTNGENINRPILPAPTFPVTPTSPSTPDAQFSFKWNKFWNCFSNGIAPSINGMINCIHGFTNSLTPLETQTHSEVVVALNKLATTASSVNNPSQPDPQFGRKWNAFINCFSHGIAPSVGGAIDCIHGFTDAIAPAPPIGFPTTTPPIGQGEPNSCGVGFTRLANGNCVPNEISAQASPTRTPLLFCPNGKDMYGNCLANPNPPTSPAAFFILALLAGAIIWGAWYIMTKVWFKG